jgi:hypothetical protein
VPALSGYAVTRVIIIFILIFSWLSDSLEETCEEKGDDDRLNMPVNGHFLSSILDKSDVREVKCADGAMNLKFY